MQSTLSNDHYQERGSQDQHKKTLNSPDFLNTNSIDTLVKDKTLRSVTPEIFQRKKNSNDSNKVGNGKCKLDQTYSIQRR